MGGKGGARHLKRLTAPRSWPIHVKEKKWTVKPKPGPHSASRSIPLTIVLRDLLGYAKNAREARIILSQGKVKVDGAVRRDGKYPVGLMDILEIQDVNAKYRAIPLKKGLSLIQINEEESQLKPCRIEGKTVVKGGHIQLNLHDGRNILVKVSDPKAPREDAYKPRDTLILSLPDQKILKHVKFQENAYALIISGRNAGKHGRITGFTPGTATRRAVVSIQDQNGETIQTVADYVFILGDEKPEVKLAAG
jgi:small subunit ribosomal protein S4e